MQRSIKLAAILVGALLPLAGQVVQQLPVIHEGRRVALIVGNQAYQSNLATPATDAEDMDRLLSKLNFETRKVADLTLRDFRRVVTEFIDSVQTGDTVLFYYSGHGEDVEGFNYLLPVDFDFVGAKEEDVKDNSISASNFLDRLRKRKPQVSLLILDACRNTPFQAARGPVGGLAEIQGARGEFVAFATAPGRTATSLPGDRNGLFTKHLLKVLSQPGLRINDIFDQVRYDVDAESDHKQTPWVNSGLVGTIYLNTLPDAKIVLNGSDLTDGFDIGVDTDKRRTEWLEPLDNSFRMTYPSGQTWGSVFVTVGPPTDPPRPGMDLSTYKTINVEMRGNAGGETLQLGVKSNMQPDNGREYKVNVKVDAEWRTYHFPLSQFLRADTKNIYVAAEFVFAGPKPETVYVRKVTYSK